MLKLLENNNSFRQKILPEIAKVFNKALVKAQKPIRDDVSRLMGRLFRISKTYNALVTGELGDILGLPYGQEYGRVEAIINTIVNNIDVTITPVKVIGSKFSGGLEIGVLVADFSDIFSLPESSVRSRDGRVLPWLEWLLVKGDQIIIAGYDVQLGNFPKSRSGNAVMVQGQNVWRVPPEYSGVINDNWLTRVIDRSFRIIENLITRIVQKHLGAAISVV